MDMKLLVTGFCAFGGNAENPTEALLRLLPGQVAGCELHTLLLPVEFARAGRLLTEEIDRLCPDAVLSLGLAASREAISVERAALNLIDARIPDNAGAQPVDAPVVPGAPAAYFATVDPRPVAAAIERSGFPAALSASAGLYVCNAVYYACLHHAATHNHAYYALFIHVPPRPAEELVRPICAAIDAIIRGISRNA